jgi:hypothetical protein
MLSLPVICGGASITHDIGTFAGVFAGNVHLTINWSSFLGRAI